MQPMLCRWFVCRGIATPAFVEPLHGFVERELAGVQVRVGLAHIRVPEHLFDVMERHSRLKPARAGLVPQMVEV
jgi:hypothetical protein